MPLALDLSLGTIFAFLLVLTRVSGVFIFIPLPGIKAGPDMIRILLSLTTTLAIYPLWPKVDPADVSFAALVAWIAAEAILGLAVGLAVAAFMEAFQMGFQILSLQAGYTFASTIDPASGADSSVLLSIAQMLAGLLFFSVGLDRLILRAFAESLRTRPPGQFTPTLPMARQIIDATSAIFSTGLRLVLPLIALLILVDLSLALLGRLNAQLQMISLAFPVKMLVTLALLAWLVLIFPGFFSQTSGPMIRLTRALLGN